MKVGFSHEKPAFMILPPFGQRKRNEKPLLNKGIWGFFLLFLKPLYLQAF
jgi:hypothetical protein